MVTFISQNVKHHLQGQESENDSSPKNEECDKTMKLLKNSICAISIVCIIALVTASCAVTAATTTASGQQYGTMKNLHNLKSGIAKNTTQKFGFENIVSKLSAAGYDTTELSALIQAGDKTKIKAWIDAFNTAHPGVLHACNGSSGVGKGKFSFTNMTSNLVSKISTAGYDTTELSALIQAGDKTKIKAWIETFNIAHPGVLFKQKTTTGTTN